MTELRKQFEALPEIKTILIMFYFSQEDNKYKATQHWYSNKVGFINGAWYAFQEQQKAIENLKVGLTDIWTNLDDRQSKEWIIEHCENIIKDLLK